MNTLREDKKMVIGFFTDTYRPQVNGVTENVETTAENLRRRGHKVYIFAPKVKGYIDKDPDVIRLDSVRYVRVPDQRLGHPNSISHFLKLTNKKFDVIHCHGGGGSINLLGYQVAVMRGVPLILTYHTLFVQYSHYILKGKVITPSMIKRMSKLVCNMADVVIVPSSKVEDELLGYGVSKPILIIPGGIDARKFSNGDKKYLRNKFSISDEKKIILYAGRLGKEKNVSFLINAFQKVLEVEKDVIFLIVGDGPEKKTLIAHAKKHGIYDHILFSGFIPQDHMPDVYASADVFTFASLSETQGLVVAEAAAAGVPVVAVSDKAICEMVQHKKTGFVSGQSPEEFAEYVVQILRNNTLRNEFSVNAKKFMVQNFSAERQSIDLEEAYMKLFKYYALNPKLIQKLRKRFLPSLITLVSLIKKVPGAHEFLTKIPRIY